MKSMARRRLAEQHDLGMIKQLAYAGAVEQLEDMAVREDNFWCLAMERAGLSVRTINRCKKILQQVKSDGHTDFDGSGDTDELIAFHLEQLGVDKVLVPRHKL